jgi:pimeloyl-ACP methyl ester carboxylesterase
MNPPVVIFVHGTWSNPTIWSPLSNYLRDKLSIVTDNVSWSGGNSASARSSGTVNFEQLVRRYGTGDRKLAVICHSHGANVVLGAEENLLERIDFLVCLNSPIFAAVKAPIPWPVWMLFVIFVLFSIVMAIANSIGIGTGSLGLAAISVALTAVMFWIANTRFAFSLLGVFVLAVVFESVTWSYIDRSDFYRLWLYKSLLFFPLLTVATAALFLVPTLTIYAIWARKFAGKVNPHSVTRLIQIVAIDDEVFSILGLALMIQRLIQFLLWPVRRLFVPSLAFIVFGMCAVVIKGISLVSNNVNGLLDANVGPYFYIPILFFVAIPALLIYAKVILFGIAYGWDIGGLSLNHSIYVSPGSFQQKTEVYTLEPDPKRRVWISHTSIHQRKEVFELAERLLKESMAPPAGKEH